MTVKQMAVGYVPYVVVGGGAVVATDGTTQDINMALEIVARTKAEAPWLYEVFPNAVESGAVFLRDGHIYFYGIAFTDIVTISIAVFCFLFVVIKAIAEMRLLKTNQQIANWQLAQKETKKEPIKKTPPPPLGEDGVSTNKGVLEDVNCNVGVNKEQPMEDEPVQFSSLSEFFVARYIRPLIKRYYC